MFPYKRIPLLKFPGILCCILCLQAFGQNTPLSTLQASFNGYQKNRLQEKLFVHTDKSFYLAGELVWFKLYCVDGNDGKPLDMSKVAYVEILDRANKPVMQAKIALRDGTGQGSFLLPASVGSGNYSFRAYTAWMKNFSPDFYFAKTLSIINTLKATSMQEGGDTAAFSARFFPEGGSLVSGLESKVGFKVADRYGRGMDCFGFIVDDRSDTITGFTSLKFGMGHFTFIPLAGRRYTALITTAGGKKASAELPAAYENGYVMQVSESGASQLKVTVKTNIAGAANASEVFLVANTRQQIRAAAQETFRNGMAIFLVDKARLGAGISQLTVFDRHRQPVCERLYFTPPTQKLAIDLKSDWPQYATRKKVTLSVDTKTAAQAASADLSVAVFRLDSLSLPDGNDIFNYLWLSSDLKGFIESPGYYFANTGAEVQAATDNLMLTHGWRRYQWNEILKSEAPAFRFHPEFNGPIVTGKITDTRTGAPVSGLAAYLSIPGTQVQLYSTQSDGRGGLTFGTKPFYGANEVVVQTNARQGGDYKIELANPFSDQYAAVQLPYFRFFTGWQQDVVHQTVAIQVQHSFAANALNRFILPALDSLPFYGNPSKTYLLDNYTRFTTMEEVLREYVSEVAVRKRGSQYQLPVAQATTPGFHDGEPLILLDGVPVFDPNKIISYDPLKVRKLEVVTNRYYYGPFVCDGIINFTTYNGALEGLQLDPRAVVVDYEGLQLRRQFYAPVYETPQQLQSRIPDFRSLLFWRPDVRTDANGKTQLDFYTSDVAGKYMAVIQGLSTDGVAGSQSIVFEVK